MTRAGPATAVGVDIGGGSVKIGLVASDGALLARTRLATDPALDGEALAGTILLATTALLTEHGLGAASVGIAFPGHIDPDGRRGRHSNVPQLDGYPLCDAFEAALGRQTRLINDADAAALAECARHPEHAGARVMVVTLGTGIGVGLVVAGRPVSTVAGTLGDPGHLNVDPSARHRCRLGCRGCLESVASAVALERDARDRALASPGCRLHAELDRLDAARLVELAREGEPQARELLASCGRWIALAVAGWGAIFQPDAVYLGGGLAAAGDPLLATIRAEVAGRALPYLALAPRIGLAVLGNDAGMIGAALVAADPQL